MKSNLAIILLCFMCATFISDMNAQGTRNKSRLDKKNLEFYNAVVKHEDDAFNQIQAPEKWSNESYVLLGIHSYLSLHNNKYDPHNGRKGFERKRVVLQDKKAVELFSEFYFDEAETVVIYLTKKDGSEREIDLSNAIQVETKGSTVYSSRFYTSKHYKMAIPGLEVGDVLDYTTIFTQNEEFKISYMGYLNSTVPIVYQNITIDYKNRCNVFQNTFNTTFKIKMQKGAGHDISGKNNPETNRLKLVTHDMEARKYTPWQNDLEIEPIYKILVISNRTFYHIDDVDIKNSLNIDALFKKKIMEGVRTFKGNIDMMNTDQYVKFFKSKNKLNTKEKVHMLYYLYRDLLTRHQYPTEGIKLIKNKQSTYEKIFGIDSALDEVFFLYAFQNSLSKIKIGYEVVMMIPENVGDHKNLVSDEECYIGIYVPELKEYFWPPTRNRTHTDMPYGLLRGASGKGAVGNTINKKEVLYKKHNIATSTENDNYDKTIMFVEFEEEDVLRIKQNTEFAGFFKDNQSKLQEEFGSQLYDDYLSIFDDPKIKTKKIEYEKNLHENKHELYSDFIDRSNKNRAKYVEAILGREDHKVNLLTHSVQSSGRTLKDPILKFSAEYTLDGLYKPLGQNISLEPGKLIGGQRFIEEKYRGERESDIFFDVPRKYGYDISIRIPEGYTIDDLSKLNKSAQNEYCSFESKASFSAGILNISTEKVYKSLRAPKSAWNDILFVMDTAYHFTQEKVILKKK